MSHRPNGRRGSEPLDGRAQAQLDARAAASSEALIAMDLQGTVTLWNTAAERLYGYAAAEMVGRSHAAVFPPERRFELQLFLEHVSRGEPIDDVVCTHVCKDGQAREVSVSIDPIRDEAGTIVGALATHRDWSDEARRQREMQRRDLLIRATFEGAVGMVLADMDGRVIEANPALLTMLGYGAEEFVGRHFTAVTHPEDVAADGALAAELRAGQRTGYQLEKRYLRKDGTTVWGRLNVSVVGPLDETPVVVAMVEDITARKQAEERVRQQEDQYRSVFAATSDGLVIRALDGTIVEANPAMCRMHGYTESELRTLPPAALIHPDFIEQFTICLRAASEDTDFRAERVDLRKDGTAFPVEVHETSFSYRGRPHILGVVRDISERTHAEAQAREKEEQYQRIFEASSDGLTIIDPDTGHVVEANPAFCAMVGYPCAELVGHDARRFIHPESHALFAEYRSTITAGGTFHARAVEVRKDGTPVPVEVHGSSVLYQGKRHGLSVVRDVSEQVAAYELLEQRVEERTRELAILLEVSRNVSSTLELPHLLGTILDQLKAVVDYTASAVYTLEGEQTLHLLDYQGSLPREDICRVWDLAAIAHSRAVIQGAEPVTIPDVRAETPLARSFRETALRQLGYVPADVASWMGVPLVLRGRVLGMLAFDHSQAAYYTPQHARLALAVANHAAVAIENARLYARAQEMAAGEERARLARELHDSVTQALFSMTMHMRAAEMALDREGVAPAGGVATNLRQVSELAQGALAEMRALIFELRPGALQEEGLVAALHKHGRALSAREGLAIEVTAPQERMPLDPTVEEQLYRMAQEALHNVVKHAGARQVWVRLERGPEDLTLAVADDGVGFDPLAVPAGHLGLHTITTRAEQIGARAEIVSTPGQGTTVQVVLPLSAAGGQDG